MLPDEENNFGFQLCAQKATLKTALPLGLS
jgi:hypothetical protein